MNLDVRTTPEADDQVRVIDGWWQRHRIAAPTLFLDELEAAFSLIGHAPDVGHSYRRSPIVVGARPELTIRARRELTTTTSSNWRPHAASGVKTVVNAWSALREQNRPRLVRTSQASTVLANFAGLRGRYSQGSGRSACRPFSEQACLTQSSRQYQSGTTARKGGIFPL